MMRAVVVLGVLADLTAVLSPVVVFVEDLVRHLLDEVVR